MKKIRSWTKMPVENLFTNSETNVTSLTSRPLTHTRWGGKASAMLASIIEHHYVLRVDRTDMHFDTFGFDACTTIHVVCFTWSGAHSAQLAVWQWTCQYQAMAVRSSLIRTENEEWGCACSHCSDGVWWDIKSSRPTVQTWETKDRARESVSWSQTGVSVSSHISCGQMYEQRADD